MELFKSRLAKPPGRQNEKSIGLSAQWVSRDGNHHSIQQCHAITCLLLLAALFVVSPAAYPCSCRYSTLPDLYERADVIFIAEIVDIFDDDGPERLRHESANFRLIESLKGEVSFPTIYTDSSNCRASFQLGQDYLIFTSDGYVGMCGGTTRLNNGLHYARAIRQYHGAVTQTLIEPWGFRIYGAFENCWLRLNPALKGGMSVRAWFNRHDTRDVPRVMGQIRAYLPTGMEFTGDEAALSIDGVRLTPDEVRGSLALYNSADAVEVLASELRVNSDILLSTERKTTGPEGSDQSDSWRLHTYNLEHALPRFLECYDRLKILEAEATH